MRAYKSPLLFFLLFAVTIHGACKSSPGQDGAEPDNEPATTSRTAGGLAGTESRDYSDPGGDFSIRIPNGWMVEREELDWAHKTVIRADRQRASDISIMTGKTGMPTTSSAERQSHLLVESSRLFFGAWLDALREQARVEDASEVYRTRFGNFNALRLDVTYYRDDAEDPRRGYAVYLIGGRTTFFFTLTAGRSQFKELEETLSTLRIEP